MSKKLTSAQPNKSADQAGFTLLEMLLVIALIAVLASIVILAINPGKQLAEARNAQRRSDVNTILNAVYQYSIDNSGALPSDIPDTQGQTICKAGAADCTGYVDLSILTTDEEYLVDIPHDPDQECEGTDTCYGIYQSITGRITVEATYAELGADISISR